MKICLMYEATMFNVWGSMSMLERTDACVCVAHFGLELGDTENEASKWGGRAVGRAFVEAKEKGKADNSISLYNTYIYFGYTTCVYVSE